MRLRATRLTAIAHAAKRFIATFSPSSLFANNEQGVWYDPSDMSTMFQDSAGTAPVSGMEQPVGLILDKRLGLGPELIVNGGFDTNTEGWVSHNNSSILSQVNGELELTSVNGGFCEVRQNITTIIGKTYIVKGKGYSKGVIARNMRTGVIGVQSGSIKQSLSLTELFPQVFTATSINTSIVVTFLGTVAGEKFGVDDISVREIPGNHATQSTTAQRPVLQARYNLLTNTETLATQTVTTMATTQRLRFEGAGTITLSGAATGTYSAGSHTFTTTAGSLTLTVSGTVTKADLRAANDGIGLPAYQRVGAATSGSGSTAGNADYDTVGFPPYLRFFGVETWLSTASINFTGTDKMTVFAGVRRMVDSPNGCFVELSADINNNNEAFVFLSPSVAGSYRFFSKGTLPQGAGTGNFAPAPDTSVITGIGDISGDVSSIRRNGALLETNSADQGSGKYGNYPLFIGRRGGTIAPFNGRFYSLIVRGAQSTAQQISDTETWVNGKTRAY